MTKMRSLRRIECLCKSDIKKILLFLPVNIELSLVLNSIDIIVSELFRLALETTFLVQDELLVCL
jgi:hypothetical protein